MRLILEELVDISKPFQIQELTVKQKILTGISYLVDKSAILGLNRRKEQQEKEMLENATIQGLAIALSSQIQSVYAKPLNVKGVFKRVVKQKISVQKHTDLLPRALENKLLYNFDVKEIPIDPDILLCFPNIERLVMVEKRAIKNQRG